MCYHTKQSKLAKDLAARFRAGFPAAHLYAPSNEINGFVHPNMPVITNAQPDIIQLYSWGLLPAWATDVALRKNTLNAMQETIHEKPSFKEVAMQRCLVLVDGFFEWQWQDGKGKQKIKFEIGMHQQAAFCLGGLYSIYTNNIDGTVLNTFSIITTAANEQMASIHNSKRRMPLILQQEQEMAWLHGAPYSSEGLILEAKPMLEGAVMQGSLF